MQNIRTLALLAIGFTGIMAGTTLQVSTSQTFAGWLLLLIGGLAVITAAVIAARRGAGNSREGYLALALAVAVIVVAGTIHPVAQTFAALPGLLPGLIAGIGWSIVMLMDGLCGVLVVRRIVARRHYR